MEVKESKNMVPQLILDAYKKYQKVILAKRKNEVCDNLKDTIYLLICAKDEVLSQQKDVINGNGISIPERYEGSPIILPKDHLKQSYVYGFDRTNCIISRGIYVAYCSRYALQKCNDDNKPYLFWADEIASDESELLDIIKKSIR